MELLEMNRWNYIDNDNIELTVEKQGTIRTFTASVLSSDLLFAIQNNIDPYGSLTLRQLTWVEKKILPVPQVQTSDKSAITYIFRYNYVKQLHINGSTDDQIRTIMSWSLDFDPGIYYNQNLFTTALLPPLPPIPTEMKLLAAFKSTTGNTAATWTDVFSYTLPANKMANNFDTLEILYGGQYVNDADYKGIAFIFGSTGVGLPNYNNKSSWLIRMTIMREDSTNAKYTFEFNTNNILQFSDISFFTPIDWTIPNDMKLQLYAPNTNACKAMIGTIKYFAAP